MARIPITYERLHPDVQLPVRSTEESTGSDMFAYLNGRRVKMFVPNDPRTADRFGTVTDEAEELIEFDLTMFPPANNPEMRARFDLPPGGRVMIPTGLKMQPDPGYAIDLHSRSGHGWKHGVTLANSVALIDSDYAEEVGILLINNGHKTLTITHGDRVAQMVTREVHTEEFREGKVAPRGNRAGGFGSTGG